MLSQLELQEKIDARDNFVLMLYCIMDKPRLVLS